VDHSLGNAGLDEGFTDKEQDLYIAT